MYLSRDFEIHPKNQRKITVTLQLRGKEGKQFWKHFLKLNDNQIQTKGKDSNVLHAYCYEVFIYPIHMAYTLISLACKLLHRFIIVFLREFHKAVALLAVAVINLSKQNEE